MRVLPGTHTLGVLTDEEIHDLSTKVAEVECLVEKGGVLGMRPLIVHASCKAQSEMPRRVLHVEYARPDALCDGLKLAMARGFVGGKNRGEGSRLEAGATKWNTRRLAGRETRKRLAASKK